MKTTKIFGGIVFAAAVAATVSARANMLVNGGLEVTSDQLAAKPAMLSADGLIHVSPTVNSNALNGWTVTGTSIDVVPNTYWQCTQGAYSVDLIGTTGLGAISQKVSGLTPGTTYELSFDFAVNPGYGLHGETTFEKWIEVQATNSSVPVAYFTRKPSGTQTAINLEYVRPAIDFVAMDTTTTITFAALFPSDLPATFADGTPVTANALYTGPVIDNINLEGMPEVTGHGNTAPTPEPASLGVLAVGGLMLLRRRR
jgi:hypothetical protein